MKCPDCGSRMVKDSSTGEYICIECSGYHYDNSSSKRKPAGCRACGNPDYPDCKSSCPMFDD